MTNWHGVTIDELREWVANTGARKFHVASNAGTWGPIEAVHKVGTADPAFADCNVFETVAGDRWVEGCSERRAPGRVRPFDQARAELHKLRDEYNAARAALAAREAVDR